MFGDSTHTIDVQVDQKVLSAAGEDGDLVGAIDQGTSSTRFLIYTKQGRIAASAQMEHTQYFPAGQDKVGWHEHDPLEIWRNTVSCLEAVGEALKSNKVAIDLRKRVSKAIGITNQRETTIAWNSETGVPYYNAIVWDDLRTGDIAAAVASGDVNRLRDKTGLPLASYFAGTKVKWLLDNVEALQADLKDPIKMQQIRFGTIDTWLVYQLTGSRSAARGAANKGGIFVTDVGNASRWLFMDIHTMKWDQWLVDSVCAPHVLSVKSLPQILPSSNLFAICSSDAGVPILDQVPIASILGDQQAALFGQCAFSPGEAKNTYGTGLFLMMNTGEQIVPSTHGLLTTVAYQLGPEEPVTYALEGSVSHSGSTIQWLRDQLGIIDKASESEKLARTTEENNGCYLVPAFAGLFAPHWRSDARACIVGMTASHHKGHICRAALEAAVYQTREVFDAMYADSSVQLKALKVDGGGTANKLMMQFQSDIVNVDVIRPVVMETTSSGAAFAAGLAVDVWKDLDEIRSLWTAADTFRPTMAEQVRYQYWIGWKKAVSRSLGWIDMFVTGEDGDSEGYATAEEDEMEVVDTQSFGLGGSSLVLLTACALLVGFYAGLSRGRK